jgi:hypothetical protein
MKMPARSCRIWIVASNAASPNDGCGAGVAHNEVAPDQSASASGPSTIRVGADQFVHWPWPTPVRTRTRQ